CCRVPHAVPRFRRLRSEEPARADRRLRERDAAEDGHPVLGPPADPADGGIDLRIGWGHGMTSRYVNRALRSLFVTGLFNRIEDHHGILCGPAFSLYFAKMRARCLRYGAGGGKHA